MAQNIQCILEDETGKTIKDSHLNFASIHRTLWEHDERKEKYIWLHTIDEYGDTTFNILQAPMIIEELESLKSDVDGEIAQSVQRFIDFIKTVSTHQHVKFIGD